jgi:hypothetical protein
MRVHIDTIDNRINAAAQMKKDFAKNFQERLAATP